MLNTVQILREVLGNDDAYIARFKLIAETANVTLDKLFLGQVDSKTEYTLEERDEIVMTLKLLVAQQFSKVKSVEKPTYTASAGAPGSGKTFSLECMFGIDISNGKFAANAIYVGPDSVVLPQMKAHLKDCTEVGKAQAYEKWRDASNYIANFMLIKAMTDNVNIVHDTTSTSTRVKTILDTLRKLGYTRHMYFYAADKEAREMAIMHRKEKLGFAMVSSLDVVSKAEAAYARLADHSYEGRVELMVLHAQKGMFWRGEGETVAFAVYNPAENPNIQVLADGQSHVDHLLQQMDAKEGLETDLQTAVHKAVSTWVQAPEPKAKLAASSSLAM